MKKLKLVFIFIFSCVILLLTSAGNTPYNYFTRLADSFLHQRLYLTEGPRWLSELIPVGTDKWLVPYSPMPAILSVPFVLIFGSDFPQQTIAQLLGAGISTIAYVVAKKHLKEKAAIWIFILTSVGTIMWYEATSGSSWYMGQLTAAFFILAAILAVEYKKLFFAGLFLGAACLSRVHTIFAFPFLVFVATDKGKIEWKEIFKNSLIILSGTVPFFLFDSWYNFVRFGVIWDKGYLLIPGVLNEPWFSNGIENITYIPRNLISAFWTFPKLLSVYPYIEPSWNSLAIWITTPAFIFSFLAPIKQNIVKAGWFSITLIFLFVLSHGSNGFAQFGYRFAIDFYPILIYLLILSIKRTGITKLHWILLFVGVLVNLWGVVWINKFGWVSF